jgi:hypothetical protein
MNPTFEGTNNCDSVWFRGREMTQSGKDRTSEKSELIQTTSCVSQSFGFSKYLDHRLDPIGTNVLEVWLIDVGGYEEREEVRRVKKKTAEIAAGYVTVLGNPSYWWIGP